MPGPFVEGTQYSPATGLVYVFNLIVGTGALTLPKAFAKTGWALGLGILLMLAFMSYITVTLVIEAMSIANALIVKSRRDDGSSESSLDDGPLSRRERERDPLIPPELGEQNAQMERQANTAANFEIKERVEMGRMASMFFGKIGVYLFYLCIAIYLYGDLAIYIAAVSKSIRDVVCTYHNSSINSSANYLIPDSDPCWSEFTEMDRFSAYRLFSISFMLVLGPFVFFNVQKTKYLQLTTSFMRWVAFTIMITLAVIKIYTHDDIPDYKDLPLARVSALPNLFGVCVYSFMCHHSLPSLVTPISSKRRLFSLFILDYVLITSFYLLLAFTGIFAFGGNLKDLYTLNFSPEQGSGAKLGMIIVEYFLSLFPVFTLSTNFPIIAITLKNNLKSIFQIHDDDDDENNSLIMSIRFGKWKQFWQNLGFPLLAVFPPFLVAVFVEDVQVLVSVTGSYAGAGIQYLIPVLLVYHARKCCASPNIVSSNPYASPFKSVFWLYFVMAWSILCMGFVTVNHFFDKTDPTAETFFA